MNRFGILRVLFLDGETCLRMRSQRLLLINNSEGKGYGIENKRARENKDGGMFGSGLPETAMLASA